MEDAERQFQVLLETWTFDDVFCWRFVCSCFLRAKEDEGWWGQSIGEVFNHNSVAIVASVEIVAWICWVSCEDSKVFSSFGNWHVGHLHSCLFGVFPNDVSSQGFREDAMPRSSNPKYICTCFSLPILACLFACASYMQCKSISLFMPTTLKPYKFGVACVSLCSSSLGNLAIAHLLLKQAQGFYHHLSFMNILNMIALF